MLEINNYHTSEQLNDILAKSEGLIGEYKTYISVGDLKNMDALHNFRHRFTEMFFEISKATAYIYKLRTSRDDKSLTQKKAYIGKIIIGTTINGEKVTFSKADKMYAASTEEYKRLIDERETYYEAYLLFRSIQETLRMFSNEIAKRID